jgi:hypothetical protein
VVESDYPWSQAVHTSEQLQANFEKALRTMDEFMAGEAPVQKAARKIARALDELGIPYAVAGGLAVAANGLDRQTVDVDLILTKEGLAAFKERWLGRGWVERFQGSKGLRDSENGLRIDILTTDGRPGDGKSCPFNFPHPETIGQRFGGIWSGMRMLDLRTLIELKIASWMTAPHRPRDMDDVIRLIKIHGLPHTYSTGLHEYVHKEFDRLWELAQVKDPYDE